MNEPAVSIVIVAHSVRDELERCLESIDAHAAIAVETILVDNASVDGTQDWVRSVHPGVTLVELDDNVGVAARRNGMRLARGRYAMFLDSDAALTPGALPSMVRALDENPEWGLVGPKLVGDDGSLQLSCRRFPPVFLPLLRRPPLSLFLDSSGPVRRHLMEDVDHDLARRVVYVLGACQLFRNTLARSIGPFPGSIFLGPDDIEWCIRIRDAGGEIVYWPDATVLHSYQRRTQGSPISRAAWLHLRSFVAFQWHHRRRLAEFARLGRELDQRAEP